MGSACTKSNEQQVMQPQTQLEYAINSEFTPFLSIGHQYNVNHKYQSFCVYLKNEFTGVGIKKTHAYKAKITKQQIETKRREFWETRVEGNTNCWQVLKNAVESEEKTSLAILAAGGLKLVNKSIQIAYDEGGHKYDVPIFCINDPISCEAQPSTEKNLTREFEEKDTTIVLRCTKSEGKDAEKTYKNTITIQEIKQQYLKEDLKGEYSLARCFINGRELMDHHKLGFYTKQIPDGAIINVFARNEVQETAAAEKKE